ncbi:hypothetical protein [Bradyrhizobium sp. DASA03120]|uniref:hypothetical protein n=1 Tax=Bradyrhizobium sp. SMVTL-02 TaxID=3395917 RepID=UPI003F72E06D
MCELVQKENRKSKIANMLASRRRAYPAVFAASKGPGRDEALQGVAGVSRPKFFLAPLETKNGFANFFVAAERWRPGA